MPHSTSVKQSNLRRVSAALTISAFALTVAACGDPSHQADGDAGNRFPTRIVLADRKAGDGFHPATGYGQTGVSPVYDGLLRLVPSGKPDVMPFFEPALATEEPKHNADATEWTVKLREGVKFSDDSEFDSEDVKATYDVARDVNSGSEVSERYDVIKEVETPDKHTAVFKLNYPLAEFNSRLTLGIAPSELVKGNVTDNPINTKPVGTGPYILTENRGDETLFKANENYWAGAPEVKELVVTVADDETTRAQRVAAGEIDGAAIAPAMASGFENRKDLQLDAVPTADWRGISFPAVPELKDPKVRKAINIGVDRKAFVDGPLGGYGTELETLISPLYGDAHDPSKTFGHDTAAAEKLLDEAGWKKGSDGMRTKDGKPFKLTLFYAGTDSLRRDIAIEFASQMKKLGLEFETKASTWDEITPQLNKASAVLGGGSAPYDVTIMTYEYLHTREHTTSEYANPGNYGSPELDRKLEQARSELDPAKRNALYHEIQGMYMENPSALCLVNVKHLYLSKPNDWKKPDFLVEPHIHGVTWGPWWNLGAWKK